MVKKTSVFILGTQQSILRSLCLWLEQNLSIQILDTQHSSTFHNNHLNEYALPAIEDADPLWMAYNTEYLYSTQALQNIFHYNPSSKFIVVLQNPIEHAYLAWKEAVHAGQENLSFAEAIRQGRNRFDRYHPIYSYVEQGLYVPYLDQLYALFTQEQVLLLTNTALLDAHTSLHTISQFLGIAHNMLYPSDISIAPNQLVPEQLPIEEKDQKYLQLMYQDSNTQLQQKYNISFSQPIPLQHPLSFRILHNFPQISGLDHLVENWSVSVRQNDESTMVILPYVVKEELILPIFPHLKDKLQREHKPINYLNTAAQVAPIVEKRVRKWVHQYGRNMTHQILILATDMEYLYDVSDTVICLRTSLLRYKTRPQDIAIPIPWDSWKEPLPLGTRTSVGFCGMPNHPKRKELIQYLQTQPNIEVDIILRTAFFGHLHSKHTSEQLEQMKEEYNQNLENNIFIACPRGAGNYSIRFYETLRAGRIPVLLDTDMVFPLEQKIDYSSIMICESTPEAVVAKIIEWIEHKDLQAIQKECRRIWETYLYFPKFMEYLPEQLSSRGIL